jgi:VanZ family protein
MIQKTQAIKPYLRVIPLIPISGMIMYLSSREGLRSDFTPAIDYILRKGAHVVVYFIQFHTAWFAVAGFSYLRLPKKRFIKISALVICSCLIFALSDEYHQIFVAGRTAKPIDIMFDSIGIISGYLLASTFWKGK